MCERESFALQPFLCISAPNSSAHFFESCLNPNMQKSICGSVSKQQQRVAKTIGSKEFHVSASSF